MLRHLDRAQRRHDRAVAAIAAPPPGESEYSLPPLADRGTGAGLLLRLRQRGLWPLCHVAHVRPVFREQDWEHYRNVNQLFADAVVAEARSEDSIVPAQYHFALPPAMVRQLPRATILTFWHIPWPNPESFGICPWRSEILAGMLGSTILGFQARPLQELHRDGGPLHGGAHRARALHHQLRRRGDAGGELPHLHRMALAGGGAHHFLRQCRTELCERLGIPHDHSIGVGVDRSTTPRASWSA